MSTDEPDVEKGASDPFGPSPFRANPLIDSPGRRPAASSAPAAASTAPTAASHAHRVQRPAPRPYVRSPPRPAFNAPPPPPRVFDAPPPPPAHQFSSAAASAYAPPPALVRRAAAASVLQRPRRACSTRLRRPRVRRLLRRRPLSAPPRSRVQPAAAVSAACASVFDPPAPLDSGPARGPLAVRRAKVFATEGDRRDGNDARIRE
jgi:hypothetical protein